MEIITSDLVKSLLGGFLLYPDYRYLAFQVEVPGEYRKALKAIRENPSKGYEVFVVELEDKYPDIYMWIDSAPREWEFEDFVQAYVEKYRRAKLIEKVKSVASNAEKMETSTIVDNLNAILKESLNFNPEIRKMEDVVDELVEELYQLRETGGIEIPFLSKLVNDLFGGELIVLAGRPGMGKTTLMLNMAEKLARDNVVVGFITLEMQDKSLVLKLVQRFWNISLFKRVKDLTHRDVELLEKQFEEFKNLEIYFSAQQSTRLLSILATMKYLVFAFDVKVFFIDYLQLIRARIKNRVEELAYITRALKEFALENNVSIFLGSQLNRNVEHRENKMPTLADLRESGAIEQDADVVVMLYRPWYYVKDEDPQKLLLKVAKQRNGVVGTIEVKFDLEKQIIEEKNEDF